MATSNNKANEKGSSRGSKGQKKGASKKIGSKKKSAIRPQRVTEIVFNAEARKEYLRGFSERKKQRRAFGLAMQKVKDRKAKLEQRAEMKKAVGEQIREAEEQKNQMIQEVLRENLKTNSLLSGNARTLQNQQGKRSKEPIINNFDQPASTVIQLYEDNQTQSQWGGEVIVTTSSDFNIENDVNDEEEKLKSLTKDTAQEYSGKVERFMKEMKGKLPSKKRKDHRNNQPAMQRGKHGAANMQGIGGDANLNIAKKMLSRTQSKVAPGVTSKQRKKTKR